LRLTNGGEVLKEPTLRAVVDEQHTLASHHRRSVALVEPSCSTIRELHLIPVARDLDSPSGAVVDAVGIASRRCNQLGAALQRPACERRSGGRRFGRPALARLSDGGQV